MQKIKPKTAEKQSALLKPVAPLEETEEQDPDVFYSPNSQINEESSSSSSDESAESESRLDEGIRNKKSALEDLEFQPLLEQDELTSRVEESETER